MTHGVQWSSVTDDSDDLKIYSPLSSSTITKITKTGREQNCFGETLYKSDLLSAATVKCVLNAESIFAKLG